MNLIAFASLLFGLQVFYWVVGRRAAKHLNNNEDYFLAGKSVSFFPLMMTFLATQVGGGLVLGSAEEAYKYGWSVVIYPLGVSLGLILLGIGLGKKLAQFQVSTVAQIFEVVYRSKVLKKIASILSIISLFMVLAAQVIASNKFLASLGFNNTLLFIAFWTIVIIYTVNGGLKAVISTDIVQAIFFSIALFLCFGLVLYSDSFSSLQTSKLQSVFQGSSKLCSWLLMPLLFMLIEQDMAQRCFAGSSPRVVSMASLSAGICTMAVCIVPVFFGVLANTMSLEIPEGASVLMTVIAKTTNPWVTAIAGCAILAAIISTATSLINAISSNLSMDFRFSFLKKPSNLSSIKKITAIISISAIFFAFYFNNIVDVLIQSYELSVSCLFVPILMALFKKNGNFRSALISILFGGAGFCSFRVFEITFPKELASILLSACGYFSGELIWRKDITALHNPEVKEYEKL